MIVPFRQGIIRYPYSGSIQDFLQISGSYINLTADNGPTELTFAHRTTNYFHVENATVSQAWGPFTSSTDQWLYWDIDLSTGTRTFGITLVEPQFGPTEPTSPVTDLHWFDTTNNIMFVYQSGSFAEVVRAFAAKFDGVTTFSTLAAGLPNLPFAGSQVGLINSQNASGRIVFDDNGDVIKRESGELFTTEDQFFATGSQVNAVRLEASVHHATVNENVAAFNIVKYLSTGRVGLAGYDDIGTSALAVVLENAATGEVATTMIQGVIANPLWNWQTVGAELWVIANGLLTETDPNISDVNTYPTKNVPVARVLSNKEIIFEQGLGGVGKTGLSGAAASLVDASSSTKGVVFLTANPASPTNPLAVGDNDARMTDARTPTAHIHAATDVTFSPSGNLSSGDVQLAIQELDTEKLAIAGGTLTGFLTLNATPTNVLHAATKQYVDSLVSGLLWLDPVHYVNLIDDSLATAPTLTAADASNVYIVAGTGGAWSGFTIGDVVIWSGSSWGLDLDDGALSSHPVGTRFGIAMESSTTPGGTFATHKNKIAILDNPATPTWSFYTPVAYNAVFVNNQESLHAFHQYAYNGETSAWSEIGGPGVAVVASDVVFTPAGNIAATEVQAALVELDTEKALTDHTHVQADITDLATTHPYDLAGQVTGKPDASATVFRFVVTRPFIIFDTGHQAKADIASSATAAFDLQINGSSLLSFTFNTSATGTFAFTGSPIPATTTVFVGDVVTVVAPGTQDATLSDIGFSLNACTYATCDLPQYSALSYTLTAPGGDYTYGDTWTSVGGSVSVSGGSGSYNYLWENNPQGGDYVLFDGSATSTALNPVLTNTQGAGSGATFDIKLTVTDAVTGLLIVDTATITFEGF